MTSGSPSAATEPVGTTRRAARMDARRFSTRHGCLVEKSRRRSGPSPLRGLGAEAGACFSWLLLFARAKRSNSLLRSRSESSASSTCFHALPLDFPAIGRARFSWSTLWPALGSPSNGGSGIRGFRSPSGREPPSLLVQRNAARRGRLSTAEWLVNTLLPQRFPYQRHSGSTLLPGFFDETQLRCSWGRGSRLTAPARSPGRSSASPVSGSPLSRRKTTCSSASLPSPGQAPCGARPSGGAKQCFAYFRRTHARRPCGVLSVGSVAAEGNPVKQDHEQQQQQQQQQQQNLVSGRFGF